MDTQAKVMVVEDEEVVRRILATLLQDQGHQVVEARDGEEALSLLESHRIDLLIADKNLPGINGLEVMRAVRERQPQAELMMITGYASYESALEALRLGACEYMEKPFLDLQSIQDRVQAALSRGRNRTGTACAADLARRLIDVLRAEETPQAKAALRLAEQLLHTLGD